MSSSSPSMSFQASGELFAVGGSFAVVFVLIWLARSFLTPSQRMRRFLQRVAPRLLAAVDRRVGNSPTQVASETGTQGPNNATEATQPEALAAARRNEIERVAPEFAYSPVKKKKSPSIGAKRFSDMVRRASAQSLSTIVASATSTAPTETESSRRAFENSRKPSLKAQDQDDDASSDASSVHCVVCLDEIEEGDTARKLPCGHVYHSACVMSWLAKHNNCPLCMTKVVERDHLQAHHTQTDGERTASAHQESSAAPEVALPM